MHFKRSEVFEGVWEPGKHSYLLISLRVGQAMQAIFADFAGRGPVPLSGFGYQVTRFQLRPPNIKERSRPAGKTSGGAKIERNPSRKIYHPRPKHSNLNGSGYRPNFDDSTAILFQVVPDVVFTQILERPA